jgi:hypothetical protein
MIKIEFNGTGEEVRNEMLKLLGLCTPEYPAVSNLPGSEQLPVELLAEAKKAHSRRGRRKVSAVPEVWTEAQVKRLLDEVRPNAHNILIELAKKPEGYLRKDLAAALNVQEQSIRGQLSSLGAALKRMGGRLSPLSHEVKDGEFTYVIDAGVAAILNQAA